MLLTKHALNSIKFSGKTIQEHMDECIANGWVYEMFEGWLCQFFDEESIKPIIYTTYINKQYSSFCNEYMSVTNKLNTLETGSQDWLNTLEYLTCLANDIHLINSTK